MEGKVSDKEICLVDSEGTPLYLHRIRQVLEMGYKPCDITILVRTNDIGEKVAIELLSYSKTLPKAMQFEVTTEEALRLKSSPAVTLIIALMRLAVNRKDSESLILYNYHHRGLGKGTELTEEENAFLDSIRSMSPDDAFEAISIRYADDLKGQAVYTLALHDLIVQFSTGKVADLSLFDKWWREKQDDKSVRVDRSKNAIEILTIHKSKGLENKVIIIPDCNWAIEPRPDGIFKNTIWAEPLENDKTKDIGKFPVSFNKDLGESFFAEGYFREVVYSYVDAINLLYVATTRAKEQLHIFVEKTKTLQVPYIERLLCDIFKDVVKKVDGERYYHYEFGKFESPEPEKAKEKSENREEFREVLDRHDVSPVSLKLRTTSARYFSDEPTELTPRSKGIRMHRLFEEATTSADIFAALDTMVENGELSKSEAAELRQQIEEKLSTTEAGEWFDGSWERIYRERTIVQINPEDTCNVEIKRPDRVMMRGREAVVVDYKFGREEESHKEQIRNYMEMLRKMGYDSIKGYVWYVSSGNIVRI
jgi:ATP-dependent exoDNAse (exonuclease V) beta subunit